ncbi:putative sortase (surface protein transpeptidase) [hydrocarbon metagenome]|uniref:Putative sortase (Surface protein transpeptidase) n=1 Tax=hydrocarbon metagenome TaxID=938273 RepID=A0A0W8E156_9ZZZZ
MESDNTKTPRKRILISLIAVILILGGITLAAFPYLQSLYYDVIDPPPVVEEVFDDNDEVTDANNEAEPTEVVDNTNNGNSSSSSKSGTTASTYLGQGTLPQGSTGVLEIPKLGLKLNVLYGITDGVLRQSIGFYPQSDDPSTGNVCIAGHRNAYGSPFWHLDKLTPGDSIVLYCNNQTYKYNVSLNYITDDRDWSIIEPTDKPALTLTTCDPKIRPADGKYNRLVIRAYLR